MADHGFTTTFAAARTAAQAVARAATIGLAAASWVVAVWRMQGMDMGVATRLGSFASFIAVWVVMMAAMMLPAATPAVLRRAQAGGGVRAVPLFIGSYLAVWALVGAAVYALYRPHGSFAAGVVAIAAGVYVVWTAAYFIVFWSMSGQTPGSRLMQVRLVTPGGGKVKPVRALVRWIAMNLAMVQPAERDRELVARLTAQRARG